MPFLLAPVRELGAPPVVQVFLCGVGGQLRVCLCSRPAPLRWLCVALAPQCTVDRGDRAVVKALAHEFAFPGPMRYTPCSDVYVPWPGLVHSPRSPPVVVAEERNLAMESYLGALGAWLVLSPRLRRERLLDMTPLDWGWLGQWGAVVLAASHAHCGRGV